MNALFLDFVDEPQKVQDFYPERTDVPKRSIPHRRELCEILRRQNRNYGNVHTEQLLEKLAKPETVCVITGQQTGLLGGPMLTLWKTLTAVRMSAKLEAQGIPCVPVFWMATEDHNWHEVFGVGLLNAEMEVRRYTLKEHLFLKRQPTGSVPVNHEEARKILIRVFREFVLPEIKEFYSHGTLAEAFARTLLWLTRDIPLLLVDPLDAQFKELGAPFFERFFERCSGLMDLLKSRNEVLRSRNYPTQVKLEDGMLPLFRYVDGERIPVTTSGIPSDWKAAELSPAALLRPVFQDFIFPTAVYVGGPAEIAYFAQLQPWYPAMDMQQPWLLPRAGVTLLPPMTRGFLESRGLQPEELYIKEETLLDALIRDASTDSVRQGIKQIRESIRQNIGGMKETAGGIEATLKKAFETSERKLEYQMQKLERKTLIAVRRKHDLLARQLNKARNVIYPEQKPQERILSIFSFSSKLPDLVRELHDRIDPEAKGHQWIAI